jgi:hypothetical protein
MRFIKCLSAGIILLAVLFCASCLSLTAPKDPRVDADAGGGKPIAGLDKNLVDTWELMYLTDDDGKEIYPDKSTRTLMEFTENGRVLVNTTYKGPPETVKTHPGKYAMLGKDEISVTDKDGTTASWPYQIKKDTLVTTVLGGNKKHHWRRFR